MKYSSSFVTKWRNVVVDECHRVKNQGAQQTQAIMQQEWDHFLDSSATPMSNSTRDLGGILSFVWKTAQHLVAPTRAGPLVYADIRELKRELEDVDL